MAQNGAKVASPNFGLSLKTWQFNTKVEKTNFLDESKRRAQLG